MARYIFDIETNAIEADQVSVVHSLVLLEIDTGQLISCSDHGGYRPIHEGVELLETADLIVGHNVVCYDLPMLRKLYPGFQPRGLVRDTLLCTRLIWPDLKNGDFGNKRKGFPPKLLGSHSLKAWGYRIGVLKGEFNNEATDWSRWTPEMQDYCEQDTRVTLRLWQHILDQGYSEEAVQLEHDFQSVIREQEFHGFRFDITRAVALQATLTAKRDELVEKFQGIFPATPEETKTPQYWSGKTHYGMELRCATKGEAQKLKLKDITRGPNRVKMVPFNPASRDQAAERLIALGWKPAEFTDTGKPKVDETTLKGCPVPQAAQLIELYTIEKRLGQIALGKQAWLKLQKNGRIHGRVTTNGAVTGRCTHHTPNVAQVPACGADYGYECRACFTADEGQVLVGTDASGLEARCLAHYLALYDGGAYVKTVTEGRKEDGTDIHSVNMQAAGLSSRDIAKRWFYALIYGASDYLLGEIAGCSDEEYEKLKAEHKDLWREVTRAIRQQAERKNEEVTRKKVVFSFKGAVLRAKFYKAMPAFKQLMEELEKVAKERKYLKGLDGRRLSIRHKHAVLNTLLQSAGALIMKLATVLYVRSLQERGWEFHREFALVAHVHDEFQTTCNHEIVEEVKQLAIQAIRRAGELFRFRCPLDGESRSGANWADTH